MHETHTTVDLNGVIEHAHTGAAGIVDRRRRALVHHTATALAGFHVNHFAAHLIGQGTHGFDVGIHVGEHALHQLEVTDGAAELFALGGVIDTEIQRTLRQADGIEGTDDTLDVEPAHHDADAFVLCADPIRGRHATLIEHQFAGRAAAPAHLVELLCDTESCEAILDDEGRDAVLLLVWRGLGIDQQHIGDRAIGNEEFAAVQHIVVTVATRGGRHTAQRIGARAGLGHAQRADRAAVGEAWQIGVLLILIGVAHQIVCAQIVTGEQRGGECVIPIGHRLADETLRQYIESGTAVFAGNGCAEQALLSQRAELRLGKPILFVHARCEVVELVASIAIAHVVDRLVFLGEAEGR